MAVPTIVKSINRITTNAPRRPPAMDEDLTTSDLFLSTK
jgi:hypothetical protein